MEVGIEDAIAGDDAVVVAGVHDRYGVEGLSLEVQHVLAARWRGFKDVDVLDAADAFCDVVTPEVKARAFILVTQVLITRQEEKMS